MFTAQLAGGRWSRRDLLVTPPLMTETSWGLWGEAQGSVLVAGGWGVVGRVDSSGLRALTGNVALGKNLTGVWGTSPTDVVAVGAEGALLHYDGKAWSPDPSGKGSSAGTPTRARRFDGKIWRDEVLPLAAFDASLLRIADIWSSGGEVFLVGDAGAILHGRP